MTTIAFDGLFLVADRGITTGVVTSQASNKLKRLAPRNSVCDRLGLERGSHIAYALTGSCSDIRLIEYWLKFLLGTDEREIRPVPELTNPTGSYGLIYDITGKRLLELYGTVLTDVVLSTPMAVGAGSEVALGAMWAGVSATVALDIVSRHTSAASMGYEVYNTNTGIITSSDYIQKGYLP